MPVFRHHRKSLQPHTDVSVCRIQGLHLQGTLLWPGGPLWGWQRWTGTLWWACAFFLIFRSRKINLPWPGRYAQNSFSKHPSKQEKKIIGHAKRDLRKERRLNLCQVMYLSPWCTVQNGALFFSWLQKVNFETFELNHLQPMLHWKKKKKFWVPCAG